MSVLRAMDVTSGQVIADRVRRAATHWTRLRGLLGTRTLPAGDGLWITPCRQVHTVGMRYAIDVVFLDASGWVVEAIGPLAPGRFSPRVSTAVSVLELPAGTIGQAGIARGQRIEIV